MPNRKEPRLKRRVWLGALLAPLTAPILYVLFIMLFVPDTTPKHERSWETALVALSVGLIPSSYLVNLVFGAPLIYILMRFEKLSFMWVVSLAAPLGAIALICLLVLTIAFGAEVHWEAIKWHEITSFLSTGAGLGVISAAVFCHLAGITMPSSGRGEKRRAT